MTIRITRMGAEGLLLDAAGGSFSEQVQSRIFAVAAALRDRPGVSEIVPGMNNLMIEADATRLPGDAAEALLQELWTDAPEATTGGAEIEIPVTYGGEIAEDLDLWADHAGMTRDEAIRLHSEATYSVAAVGAMPGFGYLSGLDPRLAMRRRKVPRGKLHEGSVIIGGAQAGVMPTTAPSGWHVIGFTEVRLFDPHADDPCLFHPGDRVRFTVKDILP
ncbi:5-oxoprolinase subunit PxpB [Pelagovum pacificum]|uniref:5-oxoprolinase subunit PxpB n=1 Tax=Pelagovum pacificum TaxID=2588711 RepID=A0A5C5G7H0_9RHOB|nr:5-oxoprolinase subunit PxpB [Pelagovum pacificum]QQA41901.1 5-oxoprolinase subunit PxpB [Pelagovum pacificum]TNY30659.1 5-oxoprolinase subunit PxpB [Pelagovum pacificum]